MQKYETVEKYEDLAGIIADEKGDFNTLDRAETLRWLDEHPEFLPERIISESRVRELVFEHMWDTRPKMIDVECFVESLGFIVSPLIDDLTDEQVEEVVKKLKGSN